MKMFIEHIECLILKNNKIMNFNQKIEYIIFIKSIIILYY